MDAGKRLLSLDALRGFDMMFIMGVASLIAAVCSLFPEGKDGWLAMQMQHAEWDGLYHHDTIFPLFLFIAGVSFPFSFSKHIAQGQSRSWIYRKVIFRGVALFLLGLVYNGLFRLNFEHLRIFSVLARIGFAWMFAALLYINFKPRTRVVIAVALLLAYWLLLKLIPVPGAEGLSPYSREGNLVGFIDRTLFAGHLYTKEFDPEGLLSLMPAIVTAMLGMFAGDFVRLDEDKVSGGKKTLSMLAAAAIMLGVGLLWSLEFPINKALWSSTFVLVVGAYSLAMFAIFYFIIDVKGWKKWCKPFEIIGLNSITIYMAMRIIPFDRISSFFLGGFQHLLPDTWASVVAAAGYVTVCWLFLYFLYRKKVFLKI